MTLPEPARRLWLLAYGTIEEHVNALSRGPHEIRLGGGTVLSARWKHRTSYDIDLTLSPEAKTTRLTAENNPALDAALRALGGTLEHEPPNYRVRFEAGWVDIANLEPRPAKGAAATAVHGKTVQVLSTTQILRGKLERGTRSPVRDVFDFITAGTTDRGGLAAAVNCLAAPRIHEIAFWWDQANDKLRTEAGAQLSHVPERFRRDPATLGFQGGEALRGAIYERTAIYAGAGRAYAEVATLDGYEATFEVGGDQLISSGLYDHIEALTGDAESTRERIATAYGRAGEPTRVWASRLGRVEHR